MSKNNLTKFGVAEKSFLVAFALLFNTLTWFYMIWGIIDNILKKLPEADIRISIIWTVFYIALVGSGILGSIVSNKLRSLRFLYFWIFLGILSSLFLVWLDESDVISASIVSLFSGFSFGLGMPSCLTYFADCTVVENRGRAAGVILFAINLATPLFVVPVKMFDLMMISVISAIWRGLGLISLSSLRTPAKIGEKRKELSFSSILHNKAFILYFIAWLMFCSIDSFEKPILSDFLDPNFYSSMMMIEAIIGSVFCLVGGWLCDFIGRKRVVIYGFIALGLGYAIIGISQAMTSWYFYFIVDGVSGGMLWVVFIFVLWGDLSRLGGKEKYYAIGSIPYFLTPLIRVLITPLIRFPAYATFSLASFFLFLAVLPLLYAPETLPERKIELRRLRKYVEEAKKVKEKYVGKDA